MESFVDAIQEFLVAIQDFLDAIQEPDVDAIQVFLDAIQDFLDAIQEQERPKMFCLWFILSTFYVYTHPFMESLKREKKFVWKTWQPW